MYWLKNFEDFAKYVVFFSHVFVYCSWFDEHGDFLLQVPCMHMKFTTNEPSHLLTIPQEKKMYFTYVNLEDCLFLQSVKQ